MSKVAVEFGAKDSGLDATIKKVGKSLDGIEKGAQKASESTNILFSDLAKAGGIAGLTSAAATKAFDALGVAIRTSFGYASKAVTDASDLGETISKVGVIFGTGAGEIERWSKTSAESLGQSQTLALDAASGFGAMGKSAGLTGTALTGFSKQMVTLATDMGSMYNSSPEDAILALGSAMRGEAEPIRRFNVFLDDATLKNRALKMGVIETTKDALTPQQKILVAHAEILAQTSDAQGDFARTSGGMAGQSKILTANLANISAELGQSLMPLVIQVTKAFNENGVPALKDFLAGMKNIDFDSLGKKLADALKLIPDGAIWDVFALKATAAILDVGAEMEAMIQNAFKKMGGIHQRGGILGLAQVGIVKGAEAAGIFTKPEMDRINASLNKEYDFDKGGYVADKSTGNAARTAADDIMNRRNAEIDRRKQLEMAAGLGVAMDDIYKTKIALPDGLKSEKDDSKEIKEKKLLELKRQGLELETKISEAIANGNLAETTRLEAQKKFNEVRQKAIDAGKTEDEANQIAERARLAFIETRENKEQAAHDARMARLKKELTLSEKIAKQINEAANLDAIDKGGKLQAKINDAIGDRNFKRADELNRRLKIAEDEAALRGGGRDRDNRSIIDIAKAAGIDTFGKSKDELRNEVLKKHREMMNPKDKGLTEKQKGERDAAQKPAKADPVDSLTKLVEKIHGLVAKIEPKLPQHALN